MADINLESVAKQMEVLHSLSQDNAAVDLKLLGMQTGLRQLVATLIHGAGLDPNDPAVLLDVLRAVDRYAADPANRERPRSGQRSRTDVVQAVGLMILLDDSYDDRTLTARRSRVEECFGIGTRQFNSDREGPKFRLMYLEYLQEKLQHPRARAWIIQTARHFWVERHPVSQGLLGSHSVPEGGDDGSSAHSRLVGELVEVRRDGVGDAVRGRGLPQLSGCVRLVRDDPDRAVTHADIESLIREAIERAGVRSSERHALEATFALAKPMRSCPYSPNRQRAAADALGLSVEDFQATAEARLINDIATQIETLVRASMDQHRLQELDIQAQAKAAADARRAGDIARSRRRYRGSWAQRARRRFPLPRKEFVGYTVVVVVILAIGLYTTDFGNFRQLVTVGGAGQANRAQGADGSVEITQEHQCRPPNLSEIQLPDVEVCVIRWCMAPVKDKAGNPIPHRSQVKIRARVQNNSAELLDLSVGNPSAMRLLVSGPTLPGSWEPFPRTATQGDAPVLVEFDNQKYWAIPANAPGDVDPIVLPDGGRTWNGFVGSWDAGVIAPGQPYFKPIRKGPDGHPVQEGNLVFNVPSDEGNYIKGLAVVDRENPSHVLAVWSSDKWPPSVDPNEF
ncbi:hypothetical protein IFM12275_41250 [Nocardia sputorum]|uniref:hypothetical protein n=1 Tax=Nocardia TaxID=1817 RepID=UPI002453AA9E|nr:MULTISPECIES: hypothetical protein [Nocardia]BDT94149.1 hypothetical protein IFM12275_41250 [Nocardia sputorum]